MEQPDAPASTDPQAPLPVPPAKIVERPSPLTGLARGGIALVAAAWFLTREILEQQGRFLDLTLVGGILLAYALLAGISGVLTWRTTTFVADTQEFRIERKLFSTTSTRIDYTKVQSVDIHQPIVARLLRLAKVHIDVGGAGGADLIYLPLDRAESLRDHIISRMHRSTAAHRAPGETAADALPELADEQGHAQAPTQQQVVARVGARNLLVGAFVSTTGLVWLAIAAALVVVGVISGEPVGYVPAVIAVGAWVWRQTGRNWGFVMSRRGDALHISRGAFTKANQGLRPDRIQGVAIEQDLIHRAFGLYSMNVTVLGYGGAGDENEGRNALLLPYGTADDVSRVLAAIWPEVDLSRIQPHAQPSRARWLTPITFRTHTWGFDEHVVVAQHGLFSQVRTIVPHRRMQSASLHQGPIARWLRLATVSIHTTDGPVALRLFHLNQEEAREAMLTQVHLARQARMQDPR